MNKSFYVLILIMVCITTTNVSKNAYGQTFSEKGIHGLYFGLSAGAQMSGIKDEDFVARNYSPMLILYSGKWFTRVLALQLGYRGYYFNTISNSDKRYYNYFSGEAVFNLSEIVQSHPNARPFKILFHAGSGYFYNRYYDRPNICAHLGLTTSYQLKGKFSAGLHFSNIMGWDIYQGNADILPGLGITVSYLF